MTDKNTKPKMTKEDLEKARLHAFLEGVEFTQTSLKNTGSIMAKIYVPKTHKEHPYILVPVENLVRRAHTLYGQVGGDIGSLRIEGVVEEGTPNLQEKLDNIYTYHAPNDSQVHRYNLLRERAKELAMILETCCPDSREKALAHTNLQQTVMWANASIAINE